MNKIVNGLITEMAMDLLDFCGGDKPSLRDVKDWMRRRDYDLDAHHINLITQTAEQFLQECKH
jgi:hypothetical protein